MLVYDDYDQDDLLHIPFELCELIGDVRHVGKLVQTDENYERGEDE